MNHIPVYPLVDAQVEKDAIARPIAPFGSWIEGEHLLKLALEFQRGIPVVPIAAEIRPFGILAKRQLLNKSNAPPRM
jgi:hypothetical protein